MGEGRTDRPSPDLDRLTVAQAAAALGISQDAVRKRIARGTIPHDRDESGRVYVYLSPSETVHKTDQDDTSKTVQDAYVRSLEDQIAFLRRELERKDAILLKLTERIPQLEAPSDERESLETVEEVPEAAESRSATGGAQEGTERPQRRRWLAPVDKLPWWHYVLGLLLVFLGAFSLLRLIPNFDFRPFVAWEVIYIGIGLLPPSVFGFWVGFRQRSPRLRPEVTRFGVLVGVIFFLGLVSAESLVEVYKSYASGPLWTLLLLPVVIFVFSLPAWVLYASGALIGNAWQRLRTERITGTTSISPLSRTTPASPEPQTEWTPQKQAYLGFAGTVIGALISSLISGLIATTLGGG